MRTNAEDALFVIPSSAADGSPILQAQNRDSSRKSFRNSPGRIHNPKNLPSVGLCLPTVQSDWPRECVNRREARGGSSGVNSSEPENPDHSANPPEHPSDMSKFEFEMSTPAGNVNELELIQVMEDSDEVKQGTIKIEDDPDSLTLEPPSSNLAVASSSNSMQELAQISSPSMRESDGDALLALAAHVSSDSGFSRTIESPDKVHRCNICGRGFRRFYCLKTHQRIHTGERPYPCRYCEKRFRHLDSLHKHQRIHTGERPYRCAECGCCFRELGQLKKHRLKHSPTFVPVTNPTFPLLPAGPSYVWPHLSTHTCLIQ
uniref:C2H2-type domain-containing protein n=1 Tax=Cyprinus carpio TaxID=7962 RepID=A0A8C2JFP1_CYPCA